MMKFIKDIFKTQAEIDAENEAAQAKVEQERLAREKELDEYFTKRIAAEKAAAEAEAKRIAEEEEHKRLKNEEAMAIYREEMKKSSEPWVEVVSGDVDPTNGIQIKLDWNDAFITYLRQNGITGENEDIMVQKWLVGLNMSIVDGKVEEKFE
jgi:hypothetical protein